MKSIGGLVLAIATLSIGAPKIAQWASFYIKKAAVEQLSTKMTPLTKISNSLSHKKNEGLNFESDYTP